MDNLTYVDYYARIITETAKGIKHVPGGTGLGKTSAITKLIRQHTTERKFIYCANRIQLLHEMIQDLEEAGIGYVHLQNDHDLLIHLLRGPLREHLYRLLASEEVQRSVKSINHKATLYRLSAEHIAKVCRELEHSSSTSTYENVPDLLHEMLQHRTASVMNFFKKVVAEAGKNEGKGKDYAFFIKHPVIRSLFPYIDYVHDDNKRVLLVTIQKAFYGFFDGRSSVSLTTLEGKHGNRIIFLDELDFLEHDLISLICHDSQISAPLQFVAHFYRAMQHHKLPLTSYPDDMFIRRRIQNIIEEIEKINALGFDFPTITQFICATNDIKDITIFETNRIIVTKDLYIRPHDRAFEIVTDPALASEGSIAAEFFNILRGAIRNILLLFGEVSVSHPILHRELIRQCFEHTIFKDELLDIRQPPRIGTTQNTRFDALLESGFGFYEIVNLEQESDATEVGLNHFTIYITPEKILASLARNNLVFGLSATALIPRFVRNFNTDWLARQPDITVYPIEPEDRGIIQSLNDSKLQQRNNAVSVVEAFDLSSSRSPERQLLQFIKAIANDEGFGGDDPQGYRQLRVNRFFATLLWIIKTIPHDQLPTSTHLLFFNSYRQIKHLLTAHQDPEHALFTVQTHEEAGAFEYYRVELIGTLFTIILYDAQKGQKIKRNPDARDTYNKLFWQGTPVVLVSTYPSAGNGVNLQYFPERHARNLTDIQHIHLLESPYFYFGQLTPDLLPAEQAPIMKENLWYLAKLFEAKALSESEFKTLLLSLRSNSLSSTYLQHTNTRTDAIHNQLATYIQALGRIERVWTAMADQTICLSRDVYEIFVVVATRPQFEPLRTMYGPLMSANLQAVFEQLARKARLMEQQLEDMKDERLAGVNKRSQQLVRRLLDRIAAFREGSGDSAAKDEWQNLRYAVLRHDFRHEVIDKYRCSFTTPYFEDGTIYLTDELDIAPPNVWGVGVHPVDMNAIYRIIAQNGVVRHHFETHGYELRFSNPTGTFFTPYCYQAILSGALGEEVIKAVLAHHNIVVETPPDQLFEIADFKLPQHPWYIDCKNYHERTLAGFSLTPADAEWRPKLNDRDFMEHAQRKLSQFRTFHQQRAKECKLIYLNMMSTDDWIMHYFDEAGNPIHTFEEASIIIVPGVLNRATPETYTTAFTICLEKLIN